MARDHHAIVVWKIHLDVARDEALHLPAQTIVVGFVHQDEACLGRRSLEQQQVAISDDAFTAEDPFAPRRGDEDVVNGGVEGPMRSATEGDVTALVGLDWPPNLARRPKMLETLSMTSVNPVWNVLTMEVSSLMPKVIVLNSSWASLRRVSSWLQKLLELIDVAETHGRITGS